MVKKNPHLHLISPNSNIFEIDSTKHSVHLSTFSYSTPLGTRFSIRVHQAYHVSPLVSLYSRPFKFRQSIGSEEFQLFSSSCRNNILLRCLVEQKRMLSETPLSAEHFVSGIVVHGLLVISNCELYSFQ